MSSHSNGHGDGAAASAFDRLFHRLVVAGDRPIVRKKKKKKKTRAKPPALAPPTPLGPLVLPPDLPPDLAERGKPLGSRESSAVNEKPPTNGEEVACVRRLRLYRNARRLCKLPRDEMIQRLSESGLRGSVSALRRRQHRITTSPLSPVECARRYVRLEAIAARLYSQQVNEDGVASVTSSSEPRVLHDFCFLPTAVAFQSRIHYQDAPPPALTRDTNPVAIPPRIDWANLSV